MAFEATNTGAPTEARGPAPGSWLFGHLKQLQGDALGMLDRAFEAHGDVTAFRFGPIRALLLAHPDHVRHVLQSHHSNYNKRVVSYLRMKTVLGEGLLTSDGAFWQRQRRIAQPAFRHGRLIGFGPTMVAAAEDLLESWKPAAATGQEVDVHQEMMRLTLRIAGETLVGAEVKDQAAAVGRAMTRVFHDFHHRLYQLLPLPEWVPTAANRRLRRAKRTLDDLVLGIIDQRRRSGIERDDLLGLLMSARDEETGQAMTDRQLRDEVMTLLLAGHETTANALAFTWYLLARHPEAAGKLRRELAEALGGRSPTVDDLPQLPYTKMVIEESMRLLPPAWIVERRAIAEDTVGGVRIPAGCVVMASAWVTHRHPGFWEDPERFDPERFRPGTKLSHRFAYFPFGAGPRVCIGGGFAMLEARLVLATLAQHVDLTTVSDQDLELDPNITLRPRHGLRMRLRHPAA